MATYKPDTVLDIYARVSRLGDERQRSPEGQADDCTLRVIERGARVGEVLVDPGRSAWNPKTKRPAWDKLMQRLESGATDGVVVFDLARFSRRPIEGERLIAAAERGLIVLDSEGEYDLTSASGKKHFREQLNSAAYESDRLSTRVTRGKKLKAMAGESNHSGRPFGFEADGITPREDEATELRRLAQRLIAGESQDAMIVDLNTRGILTAYGKKWTRASLRQVLTRPRNAGLAEYKGEILERRAGEPIRLSENPILDPADYDRICSVYVARRRGRPISDAYLCSGVVRCGLCRHPLTGRPRANLKPYPDGNVRRQYWCQPRSHNGGCGGISVDQRELDRHVGALALAILSDPRHAKAVETAAAARLQRCDEIDAEISECENLAEVLAARLGRREITLARHDAAVKPLDRQLAELRAERAGLDSTPELLPSTTEIATSRAEWDARWLIADPSERRVLLRRALRGRTLLVMPADRTGPRVFDPRRIALDPPLG